MPISSLRGILNTQPSSSPFDPTWASPAFGDVDMFPSAPAPPPGIEVHAPRKDEVDNLFAPDFDDDLLTARGPKRMRLEETVEAGTEGGEQAAPNIDFEAFLLSASLQPAPLSAPAPATASPVYDLSAFPPPSTDPTSPAWLNLDARTSSVPAAPHSSSILAPPTPNIFDPGFAPTPYFASLPGSGLGTINPQALHTPTSASPGCFDMGAGFTPAIPNFAFPGTASGSPSWMESLPGLVPSTGYASGLSTPESPALRTPGDGAMGLPPFLGGSGGWGPGSGSGGLESIAEHQETTDSPLFGGLPYGAVPEKKDMAQYGKQASLFGKFPSAGKLAREARGEKRERKGSAEAGVASGRARKARGPMVTMDAPTQTRNYITPSSTSRKEIPAHFLRQAGTTLTVEDVQAVKVPAKRKRGASSAAAAQPQGPTTPDLSSLSVDEGGELPPTLANAIEAKRRQNTLAARRSRAAKADYLKTLEDRAAELEEETKALKARFDSLGEYRLELLRRHAGMGFGE